MKANLFLAVAASLAISLRPCPAAADPPAKPNIILFLSDDHGIDFLGCYGNKIIHTPNIDRIAQQGARFNAVFAASPTCSPSRAALYTGLYPARNGTMGNHTDCRPGLRSLPQYLRPLGYRVVIANKADVRPEEVFNFEYLDASKPRDPSINRRYRKEGLDTAAIDRFLASHVKDHPNQPLCLVIGESGPHVVWEHNKTYDPASLPVLPIMVDTPKTRTALSNYYQDITSVDQRVGEVTASMEKHGFGDNTLFIYSTDQGPEWPHCKWTVYDTGLRVPFVARWPGKIKPGSTRDALMSLVDVLPTFIDVAGGNAPPELDGRSFKEVLVGQSETFRDRIYATHTGDKDMNVFPQRAVRDARYKFVLNLHPERLWTTHFTKVPGIPDSHKEVWDTWVEKARSDPAAAKVVDTIEHHPAEELYDTQSDPYELHNIAGDPSQKQRLDSMRADLKNWMVAIKDPALDKSE